MEVKIQAIKFDATAKLQDFIQKRLQKLDRFYDGIATIDVTLKVVKPETANNKEAEVKLIAPHLELFADKISDSFEQSVDECADALQRQLIKAKEKK
ncbi:MAG: ribosome-associated translation inhibitor RaiA [Paludibacteraceae bacterium]|nr:ribosome-associated translation inhibitor RaiA [Paludibacteraceae bacterium]